MSTQDPPVEKEQAVIDKALAFAMAGMKIRQRVCEYMLIGAGTAIGIVAVNQPKEIWDLVLILAVIFWLFSLYQGMRVMWRQQEGVNASAQLYMGSPANVEQTEQRSRSANRSNLWQFISLALGIVCIGVWSLRPLLTELCSLLGGPR